MVRVPKDMYDAIGDIIRRYPQYGWKGPSEFIRDAVRRYVDEVRHREVILKMAVKVMPGRVKEILSKFMGQNEAVRAYEEISKIDENNPQTFIDLAVNILKKYVGETMAEIIAKRIVEEKENEGEYGN